MSLGATEARPGAIAQELGLVACLWSRELLRFARERARWIGALVQPLLFWLIAGTGMAETFRITGAEDVRALTYLYPGVLVMIVLFSTIFTTISLVEDRQSGFMQAVLVAPGSRLSMVVGKVAGVVTLTLIQVAVFLALAPFAGLSLSQVAWGRLALVTVVACVGLTSMNFSVAWLLDSVQGYHVVMSVVLLPLWFLSGSLFPRPESWLGWLMTANPLVYAVDGVRASLAPDSLGVVGFGYGTSLLVLGGFAVVTTLVAARICRRRA